jgi:hypothetical protein
MKDLPCLHPSSTLNANALTIRNKGQQMTRYLLISIK